MRKSEKPRDEEEAAPPSSKSGFIFTLVRVAVAQICQSKGFKGAQISALEALTDVATRYLKSIAKLGASSANSGGRTQSNLGDIIVALEDLASLQGFVGSSTVRGRSLYTSAVVKDLIKFVSYSDEIPFARPLPPRGTFSRRKFLKCGENSRKSQYDDSRHVPRWLPAVPVVVAAEVAENGEERKRRWGCLEERDGIGNWDCGERRTVVGSEASSNEIDTSAKRVKMRFKMGSSLAAMAIGSAGIRKRVWCDRLVDYQENLDW